MIIEFGGGLNENPAPDLLECRVGYNFELQKNQTKLRPRKPFDLKGTAPNSGDIRGLMQLIKRDATQTTLVQAATSVYTWDGSTTWASTATVASTTQLRGEYWSLGDYLVISDLQKQTVMKKWTGSAFSTLTTALGADLYAKYAIAHLGRMWLFNVRTTTDTPHLVVASTYENPESYSTAVRASIDSFTTGREAFYMHAPDLKPINGAQLFHDQLIISTENGRLYKLTGTSAQNFAWTDFYAGSAALGSEAMVNIGNDVVYMRRGGNIESLRATDQFGDVSTDDISRFIPDTTKDLTDAIAIYDQTYQKVFFFVAGKVLVLFKDIMNEPVKGKRVSPWSVYRTTHGSNFNTHAAKYMRIPGTTAHSVYWGDDAGRIFDMNGVGSDGDGGTEEIAVLRKGRLLDKQMMERWPWLKKNVEGRVHFRRVGECPVTFSLDWADEYNVSDSTVILKGPPSGDPGAYFGGSIYFGGSVYFSQGFAFADKESSRGFSPIGRGPGFFFSVSSQNKVRYEVDYVELT